MELVVIPSKTMKDILILTEKPSVAKTFAEALGAKKTGEATYKNEKENITITHCIGHLVEAYTPEDYNLAYKKWTPETLPIIPEEQKYKIIREKKKTFDAVKDNIKKAIAKNNEIMIATDAGQEGELIAQFVLEKSNAAEYPKISRFWESQALTKKTIENGFNNRKDRKEYYPLVVKGKAWKESDWITGINMTRAITLLKKELMPTGRVQTPVLKEVKKREELINNFKKEKYEEGIAITEKGIKFKLLPESKEKDDEYIKKGCEATQIKKILKVIKTEEKEEVENIPHLYDITELQKEANKRYGITPKETTNILQELYEKDKVISYPRTPSRVMGENDYELMIEVYRKVIEKNKEYEGIAKEENLKKEDKRIFNNSELEDHHALIVLDNLGSENEEKRNIYNLIKERFLMQFSQPHKKQAIEINASCDKYTWKAKRNVVLEQGWKGLKKEKEDDEETVYTDRVKVDEGDLLKVKIAYTQTKETNPPKKHTYATILEFMKNPKNESKNRLQGIGTPATRHEILEKLKRYKYIREERKAITITEKGMVLLEEIQKIPAYDKETEIETTTRWEEIAIKDPKELVEKTKRVVIKSIKELEERMKTVTKKEVIAVCPSCGGNIVEGAKNFYCDNYKKEGVMCENKVFKHVMGKEFDKEKVKELFEKGGTEWMEGTKTNGDKTDFKIEVVKGMVTIIFSNERPDIGNCPKCGNPIYEGKKNFYCKDYKNCNFTMWKETAGTAFTHEMIKKLSAGEILENVVCKTKEGVEYISDFKLDTEYNLEKTLKGNKKE